jgi:DNA primase
MTAELFARPDALAYVNGRGITDESILEFQLGVETEGKYEGWLAMPYLDGRGRWRTTRYRSLPPMDKAYMTVKGSGTHLWNVRAAESPVVAICEGELDGVILNQLGIAAVALPGVTQWRRAWRWLFRNSDLVYVVIDHAPHTKEEARTAEWRALNQIRSTLSMVTEVEAIELPEGTDVNDLYLRDPEQLEELFR